MFFKKLLPNGYAPFLMWFFPLLFFAYQFILRLWPGLMINEIIEQFSIDATSFGLLAALYYYGYAGMQIPVAMLLDRFSARNIVFFFALICGIATMFFTYTDTWYVACISRFFIGVGSAAGFLSVSKVVSEWFPKSQYANMIGFSFTFGLMGAIYGGKPVSILISTYSWQHVALTLAFVSICIGLITFLILRSPNQKQIAKLKEINQSEREIDASKKDNLDLSSKIEEIHMKFSDFKILISMPIIWLLGAVTLLMVGSLEGFADVWGVPYLTTVYHLEKSEAAGLISFIFIGMLFGGPLLALCARKFGNYTVIGYCGATIAIIFVIILSNVLYNWWLFAILFFIVGLACCYQVIIFASGTDLVKAKYTGVVVAFLNSVNMFGGSFFHTFIGTFMDIFWTGALDKDGLREYSISSYQGGLAIIPICSILGVLIIFFVSKRNTKILG